MKKLYLSFLLLSLFITESSGQWLEDSLQTTQQLFNSLSYTLKRSFKQTTKKAWTIIIYMAADNDLAPFARKNIMQLARVGSTPFVNILIHLDILLPGKKKTTLRYYVEKERLIVTNNEDPQSQKMDSGNPETLISACKWGIEDFPADNYMLVMWNHGIGTLDLGKTKVINPSELFIFNTESKMLDLDRSIPFTQFVSLPTPLDQRGICFDDSTGHYLNNDDLIYAFSTIQKKFLNNKKISIICFDACLMAMIEVASLLKPYADFMVASQEVELGSGYDYEKIMKACIHQAPDQKTLAKHIVTEYGATYARITQDYTQSALDLSKVAALEATIDTIAGLLIEALKDQKNQSVKDALKTSRHKLLCTHFDEPSYVDLHHVLTNIAINAERFTCNNQQRELEIKLLLRTSISNALKLIQETVFANVAGANLKKAQGISIYFPEFKLHTSYRKNPFAVQNKWLHFLIRYILA